MSTEDFHNDFLEQLQLLLEQMQRAISALQEHMQDVEALKSLHRASHTCSTDATIMKQKELSTKATALEHDCAHALQEDTLSSETLQNLVKRYEDIRVHIVSLTS